MKHFINKLFGYKNNRQTVRPNTYQPAVEAMEARLLLAGDIYFPEASQEFASDYEDTYLARRLSQQIDIDQKLGVLSIMGSDETDIVQITDDIVADKLELSFNGVDFTFSSRSINTINADLGNGGNSFSYQLGTDTESLEMARVINITGGNPVNVVTEEAVVGSTTEVNDEGSFGTLNPDLAGGGQPIGGVWVVSPEFYSDPLVSLKFDKVRTVTQKGGQENVTINLFTNAAGQRVNIDSQFVVNMNMKGGRDVVEAVFGPIEERGSVRMNADLGAQNDNIIARMHGNISGSLDWYINGQGDTDEIIVDMTDVDVSQNATVNLNLFGGDGQDSINTIYRGKMEGTFNYRVNGDGSGLDWSPIMGTPDVASGLEQLGGTSNTGSASGGTYANYRDNIFTNIRFNEGSTGRFDGTILGGAGSDWLATQIKSYNTEARLADYSMTVDGGLDVDYYWSGFSEEGFEVLPIQTSNVEAWEPLLKNFLEDL